MFKSYQKTIYHLIELVKSLWNVLSGYALFDLIFNNLAECALCKMRSEFSKPNSCTCFMIAIVIGFAIVVLCSLITHLMFRKKKQNANFTARLVLLNVLQITITLGYLISCFHNLEEKRWMSMKELLVSHENNVNMLLSSNLSHVVKESQKPWPTTNSSKQPPQPTVNLGEANRKVFIFKLFMSLTFMCTNFICCFVAFLTDLIIRNIKSMKSDEIASIQN
jgi:hypothetical protein